MPAHEDDIKPGARRGTDLITVNSLSAPGDAATATSTLPLMSSASTYSSAVEEAANIRSAAGHLRFAHFASVPQQSHAQQQNTTHSSGTAAAAALIAAPAATEASASTSTAEEAAARYENIMALVAGGRLDQHQHQLLQRLLQQQRQQLQQPLQEQRIQIAAPSASNNPSVGTLARPRVAVNIKNDGAALLLQTATEASAMGSITTGEASAAAVDDAIHKRNLQTESISLHPSLASASSSSSTLLNLTPKKRTAVMMKAKHRPLPLMKSPLKFEQQQPIIKVINNKDNNDDNESNGFAPSLHPHSLATQKSTSSMSPSNKSCSSTINKNNGINRKRRATPLAQKKPKSNLHSGDFLSSQSEQKRPPQQKKTSSSVLLPAHTIVANEPQPMGRRPGFAARTLEQLQDMTRHWYTQAFRQHQSRYSSNSRSPSDIGTSNEENSSASTTRMFTLYFNETSVQAVAYWANYDKLRSKSNDNKNMNGFLIPTVDVRYRLCGACFLYGHYELECPSLTRDMTLRFARDLQTTIRTQQGQECRKKQRQQHQSTRGHNGGVKEMLDTDTDTDNHREIPYDVAVENCDGYLIEQRAESELDVTEVDEGVVIQAAASVEAFLGVNETHKWGGENTAPPHEKSQKLNRGDLVAWPLPSEPANTANVNGNHAANAEVADVCVGVVEDESPQSPDKILIKIVDTIPREQNAVSSKFPRDIGPPMDSCVWVEHGAVHLVEEPARLLQSRRSILLGKRKTGWFENQSRNPRRTTKHRKDGTFARPAGRAPVGHRWDAAIGNWVLEAA